MEDACAVLFARLTKQHQEFLADAKRGVLGAMRAENRRLMQELRHLRTAEPDAPAGVPPALPMPRVAFQEAPDLEEKARAMVSPTRACRRSAAPELELPGCLADRLEALDQRVGAHLVELSGTVARRQRRPSLLEGRGIPGFVAVDDRQAITGSPWSPQTPGGTRRHGHASLRAAWAGRSESSSPEVKLSRAECKDLDAATMGMRPVASMEEKHRTMQARRLKHIFALNGEGEFVTASALAKVLKKRAPSTWPEANVQDVAEVISELRRIRGDMPPALQREASEASFLSLSGRGRTTPVGPKIQLKSLIDALLTPHLPSQARASLRHVLAQVQECLLTPTVEEVLDDLSRGEAPAPPDRAPEFGRRRWEAPLNFVSSGAVVVSMITMGISMDVAPNDVSWICMDAICATVFITEFLMKSVGFGCRRYCFGEGWEWNWLDVLISVLSTLDVLSSIFARTGGYVVSGAKMLTILRALRVARVVRLMKLLRSPLLKDLGNMLSGILIGMPALLWVIFLLFLVLYTFGMLLRSFFGPAVGQDLTSQCGDPDQYAGDDPACKLHYLYGERFFGTVLGSMFTTFRFMMGDYTSTNGTNLALVFSTGYGLPFNIVFVMGMILTNFGLFNIITAIFVDGIIAGLKYNDVRRKYARMYEHDFVRTTLAKLVHRINEIQTWSAGGEIPDPESLQPFVLTEEEFFVVLQDPGVQMLLQDLDVQMFNPGGLFDTFDPEGLGQVSLASFVNAVLRLRGEPQKNDVIASFLALRVLQDKMDRLEELIDTRRAVV